MLDHVGICLPLSEMGNFHLAKNPKHLPPSPTKFDLLQTSRVFLRLGHPQKQMFPLSFTTIINYSRQLMISMPDVPTKDLKIKMMHFSIGSHIFQGTSAFGHEALENTRELRILRRIHRQVMQGPIFQIRKGVRSIKNILTYSNHGPYESSAKPSSSRSSPQPFGIFCRTHWTKAEAGVTDRQSDAELLVDMPDNCAGSVTNDGDTNETLHPE